LWSDTTGTGSLSLSFESVLEKAQNADFWINTSQFTTYQELDNDNAHYSQFKAYKDKKAYTFSLTKGETGGLLYYELAPNRPDIVLKDLIHIVHPELLPNHQPFFFKPLE
jgi:iron complex transport system substrate-binding protein